MRGYIIGMCSCFLGMCDFSQELVRENLMRKSVLLYRIDVLDGDKQIGLGSPGTVVNKYGINMWGFPVAAFNQRFITHRFASLKHYIDIIIIALLQEKA